MRSLIIPVIKNVSKRQEKYLFEQRIYVTSSTFSKCVFCKTSFFIIKVCFLPIADIFNFGYDIKKLDPR
jgi:hypothetical protein